jgi:molybdopterin-guanine dinucleotide biosynthesis protein A
VTETRGRPSTSLLIVGGGRGLRLGGQRKALLDVGGRPIIARLLDALAPLVDEVLVLADDRTLETLGGVRLVLDAQPHAGVLPALAQGLATARGEVCLVVASDMPFVSRAAFEHLLTVQRHVAADAVVPRIDGVLQPMHMVVRRAPALQAVRTALASGEQRLFKALLAVHPHEVEADELRALDPDLRTFFNVNTPDDLVEARWMAHEQAAGSSGSACPGAGREA